MRRVAPVLFALLALLSACASTSVNRARPAAAPPTPTTTVATTTSSTAVVATTLPVHLGDRAIAGATVVRTLALPGVTRSYRLYTPRALDGSTRVPLVVVLHGASGNAARVEFRYHWDRVAAAHHFFVVYPQGVDDHWNPYLVPGASDDIEFVAALLDHLARVLPVDTRRVYVAGMSNGGAMTYRLGCALAPRLAAIAAVEAWNPGCNPATPVALIAVHGLADSEVAFSRAQASVASWRSDDGCSTVDRSVQHALVTSTLWPACRAGTAVAFDAVAGGGHEWPGSWPPLPGHAMPSSALDATAAIWAFFSRHAR